MPAYKKYLREAKRRETTLGARFSALKRKHIKLTNDLKAEQARCNHFITAKQVDRAKESLHRVLQFPAESTALAKETEEVGHEYVKERAFASLG